MACYHPWQRDRKDGVRQRLPCGQCIGCRLERSRQWAVRMMHEASLYDANCVVTLTYDDAHLPARSSLDRRAFPLFMRRLRKRGVKARYFHCGEYGDKGRPHYHGCLFGHDFPDKALGPPSKSGAPQWFSSELEGLWPYGISAIGSLNFESAAYIARYVTKKVTGSRAREHYERVDERTGEVYELEPEFATMSRRPGIAKGWFDAFVSDAYPADEVIVRGVPCKPPRYYDQLLKDAVPELSEEVVRARSAGRDYQNASAKRLRVREVCTEARLSLSPRSIE